MQTSSYDPNTPTPDLKEARMTLFLIVLLLLLSALFLFSCTSKHIQKSVVKSDSTQVKKSAVITKADLTEISTSTDTGKEKEVIEETTVKEVDTAVLTGYLKLLQQLNRNIVKGGDTLTPTIDNRYPINGTAQDFLPTKTTTTKRTTRTVDHNKKDSSAKIASNVTSDIKSDSVTVKKEIKQVDRKVFRFNWWWLLLILVPFIFRKVRAFFRLPF